ncbi:hypothetical protein LBYZC6_07750 [Lacrimispora brassicae]
MNYRKFIEEVIWAYEPLTAHNQEFAFKKITEELLGENCSFGAVKEIYGDIMRSSLTGR